MRRLLARMALCGAAAMLTACAGAGPSPQQLCFRPEQVRTFSSPSAGRLIIETEKAGAFALSLGAACRDLASAAQLRFDGLTADKVCRRGGQVLIIEGPGGARQRCIIRDLERLAPDGPAAAGPPP